MTEGELRRIAATARFFIPRLIHNQHEAAELDAILAEALTLPDPLAGSRLRRIFSAAHPMLTSWFREQTDADGTRRSSDRQSSRDLVVVAPEMVRPGGRLAIQVFIGRARPPGSRAERMALEVPAVGVRLTIDVTAPGLIPETEIVQNLHVPESGDSERIRFGFRAGPPGDHTILVSAFHGGTFVGDLTVHILVTGDPDRQIAPGTDLPPRLNRLNDLRLRPGEATLVVNRTHDGRLQFQLRGEETFPVVETQRLAADPSDVTDLVSAELGGLAEGYSQLEFPLGREARLRNLGVNLWADAVPDEVREHFWQLRDRITTLTIAGGDDPLPWELLYPLDRNHDHGFLAEQFPVLRRLPGQSRSLPLPFTSAVYVVPPGSPRDALTEVDRVRSRLGSVRDLDLIEDVDDLQHVLDFPPSVIHFACHNAFTTTAGSHIELQGGAFRPSDLGPAVQTQSLLRQSPLVFLNACRSAGEVAGLTRPQGWAQQFLAAGAGAFIGSLWPVRSSSAADFADSFYAGLLSSGLPLGQAVLAARQRIATGDGDPTWLAYTVYGDPMIAVTGVSE